MGVRLPAGSSGLRFFPGTTPMALVARRPETAKLDNPRHRAAHACECELEGLGLTLHLAQEHPKEATYGRWGLLRGPRGAAGLRVQAAHRALPVSGAGVAAAGLLQAAVWKAQCRRVRMLQVPQGSGPGPPPPRPR